MLPTYSRLSQPRTKSFRTREKLLIGLVLLTFVVCFGGLFYLPDFKAGRVQNLYKQIQRAGPEMFIPAPPIDQPNHHHHRHGAGGGGAGDGHDVDRAKLFAKIKEELGDLNLDRPETAANQRKLEDESETEISKNPVPPPNQIEENVAPKKKHQSDREPQQQQHPNMGPVPIPKSEDTDVSVTEKRNKVREVS